MRSEYMRQAVLLFLKSLFLLPICLAVFAGIDRATGLVLAALSIDYIFADIKMLTEDNGCIENWMRECSFIFIVVGTLVLGVVAAVGRNMNIGLIRVLTGVVMLMPVRDIVYAVRIIVRAGHLQADCRENCKYDGLDNNRNE